MAKKGPHESIRATRAHRDSACAPTKPRSARCQGRAQPPHHRSRSSCSSVRPTRRSRAASIGITAQFRQSLFFGQAHALLDSGFPLAELVLLDAEEEQGPISRTRLDLKGRARLSSKKIWRVQETKQVNTHLRAVVSQEDERNRSTPAVRPKGHSAKAPEWPLG